MKAVLRGARAPLAIFAIGAALAACNNSVSSKSTSSSNNVAPLTTVTATLTLNDFTAFLATSSMADLQTSGLPGLTNEALVLEDRAFIHVLDLATSPPTSVRDLQLDPGGPLPAGAAAGSLTIANDSTALATASGLGFEGVYIFNPLTATVQTDVTLVSLNNNFVPVPAGTLNSAGATVATPMSTTYTASAVLTGGRIFIASSNLDPSFNYNPGTVCAFDYNASTGALTSEVVIFTSAFDPTRLTVWTSPTGQTAVLCVNAGDTQPPAVDASSIDVIAPSSELVVGTIQLGAAGASGAIAITPDTTRGFVGSSTLNEVLEINLDNLGQQLVNTVPANLTSLLVATYPLPGASSIDFIAGVGISASGRYLYTVNFNESLLAILDLIDGPGKAAVVGQITGFQRSGNPLNFVGNASVLAVRSGTPGVSFTGPSVLVGTINLAPADRAFSQDVNYALDGVSFNHD
jgi:hypothetical protein